MIFGVNPLLLKSGNNIPDDYIAFYKGGLSGSAVTDETGSYNGTAVNDISTRTGPDGVVSAISFLGDEDGAVDYVNSTRLPLNGDFTISFWVYIDAYVTSASDGAWLISNRSAASGSGNEFQVLSQVTTNTLRLTLTNSAGTTLDSQSSSAIPTGQWAHCLAKVSGNDMTVKLNNTDEGSGTFSGTRNTGSENTSWGRRPWQATNIEEGSLNGAMTYLRVYDRATTEAEDLALFNEFEV